jgi:enolase
MNSIEAVSVSKVFDINATDAAEVEIVTTSGYGRCSFPAPGEAIRRAREQVPTLIGREVSQQAEIDEELQGIFSLPNMSMAFSVAIANAAAASLGVPLYRYLGGFFANAMPYPLLKIFSADADYFGIPIGAGSFASAIASLASIHRELNNLDTRGDSAHTDILNRLTRIIDGVSGRFGFEVKLGMDFKASKYAQGKISFARHASATGTSRLRYLIDLARQYDLYYIEDPFDRTESEFQRQLIDELGVTCLIASDGDVDTRIADARSPKSRRETNLALIAPTGTVSSVFETYSREKADGRSCALLTDNSATCDASPSQLAVALSAPFVKLSITGRQSSAKINELIRIEQELFDGSSYRMAKKPI